MTDGTYLELLLDRRESDAAQLVETQLDRGVPLVSVYTDLLAGTAIEVISRHESGELSDQQQSSVMAAIERGMSKLASKLLEAPSNGEVAAAVACDEASRTCARLLSAALGTEGFDAYYVGPESMDQFEDVLADCNPNVYLFCTHSPDGIAAMARAIDEVRQSSEHPYVIVGGLPETADPTWWKRIGADVCVATATEAVAAARDQRYSTWEKNA